MSKKRIAAIPTKYAGVQFRSRLEARWAAYFDVLNEREGYADYEWSYEPFDLPGWIPDFQVRREWPLLVLLEVKPPLANLTAARNKANKALFSVGFHPAPSPYAVAHPKVASVQACPWREVSLDQVVADSFPQTEMWHAHCFKEAYGSAPFYQHALVQIVSTPKDFLFSGKSNPDEAAWREAGNRVQWKAPRGR